MPKRVCYKQFSQAIDMIHTHFAFNICDLSHLQKKTKYLNAIMNKSNLQKALIVWCTTAWRALYNWYGIDKYLKYGTVFEWYGMILCILYKVSLKWLYAYTTGY